MLKKKYIFILFIFIIPLLFAIGSSTWIIINEKIITPEYVSVSPVAYIHKENVRIEYNSVEEALNSAVSGDSVYIIPGSNPVITQDCTIISGVKLCIPYEEEKIYLETDSLTSRTIAFDAPNTYLKNNLIINSNVTLTNNGTIEIGGVISGGAGGGAPNSHTAGNYGQITLKDSAKIKSNGDIICYGFIAEESNDNGSQLEVLKGKLQIPFVVIEHRGGSIFAGMWKDLQGSPFNRFYMPNITSKLSINSGAELIGFADLYASSQHNTTLINIIGISNTYLVELGNESIIEAKYNHSTKITQLDIYGSSNLNSLNMTIVGQNITTSTVLFPLSWYYNVTLNQYKNGNDSIVNFNQNMKILPGGIVKINDGVTVNASKLTVYDTFNDVSVGAPIYEKDKEPGKLIVNGILNVTDIGGIVLTENSNAKLVVSGNTSVTSSEIESKSGSSFLTTVKYQQITDNFQIYPYTIDGPSSDLQEVAAGTYYSKDGSWYSNEVIIGYDTNGGMPSQIESELPKEITTQGYLINSSDLTTIIPTKEHYTFGGWYLDRECSIEAIGSVIYSSVTLYAKWVEVEYNITYDFDNYYNNFTTSGNPINNPQNPLTYNINTNTNLYLPTNGSYIFDGWYLDSEYTIRISEINGLTILSSLADNYDITLYGMWYPENEEVYTITYINSNNDIECKDKDEILGSKTSSYVLPDLSSKNNDTTYNKYFDGWYLDENFNTKFTELTSSCTLYAKWIDKNELTLECEVVDGQIVTVVFYYMPNTSYTIPEPPFELNKIGHQFKGWTVTGGTYDGQILTSGMIVENLSTQYLDTVVLTSYFEPIDIKITVTVSEGMEATVTKPDGTSEVIAAGSSKEYIWKYGEKFKVIHKLVDSANYENPKIEVKSGENKITAGSDGYYTVVENAMIVNVTATKKSTCIIEGTLITLADGTKKKVEDLQIGDILLVYNHETGKWDYMPLLVNVHIYQQAQIETIINLKFDDGTILRISGEHGLFDVDLNQYVYITVDNMLDYIGHSFISASYNEEEHNTKTKKLIDVTVTEEFVRVYNPASVWHLNLVANDMLTLSAGMVNFFEYGENLKYDEDKMQADIDKYGLYTYEDFKDYVSLEVFNAFPFKYFKVAVGKGLITYEDILILINYYNNSI